VRRSEQHKDHPQEAPYAERRGSFEHPAGRIGDIDRRHDPHLSTRGGRPRLRRTDGGHDR
jgi:hypothetical protein